LYLGAPTLDARFATQLLARDNWGFLLLQCLPQIPASAVDYPKRITLIVHIGEQQVAFPLHYLQEGWPAHIRLTLRNQPLDSSD
jgi:hypothetical protein